MMGRIKWILLAVVDIIKDQLPRAQKTIFGLGHVTYVCEMGI